ncbi:NAD(P)-dependent oxidoreductase [Halomonas sp. QX-2]|jgi:3-hydroxyisobutyrate dehydrogenase-like beta-hydroxyacid dehydrogenase|uniref:NAD(P)-dependent oxidoreductase n=1 Tax=Vreelandella sedimenti TaxID=2729618 RepID=A0A7Z0SP74_9GAMM|nr:NAD(P)-dependent oxidoreductase [Halomonas sedimenti]NYT73686.1 NAD(P)-dependent oxidoreductase [Halomonas sedimenti]|tara:strand:- start:4596 stop:5492 length:897 start_codon:yes stop_codon:yes gene_type:complete
MTSKSTIGFIGLGKMGAGFTARLIESGYSVIGYDIDDTCCQAAKAKGVEIAESPAKVAERADIIQVCVISTKAVEAVILGEGGIAEVIPGEGKTMVDHSTTELETTKRLAKTLLERNGMQFVDAPVSGGPGAATEGRLAIMAGGGQAAINAIEPLMSALGKFTRMGEVGAGQATKLINQALVLSNYCVIAEACNLGNRFGIDVSKIPEALSSGYAGGNLLNDLLPRMVENDFEPRGYARQILKDLHMLQDAANALNVSMPMAGTANSLFSMLVSQGKGELDGAAIVSLLEGATPESSS